MRRQLCLTLYFTRVYYTRYLLNKYEDSKPLHFSTDSYFIAFIDVCLGQIMIAVSRTLSHRMIRCILV